MSHIKKMILRGITSAWIGPVVLAIVYACLKNAGVVESVSVDELVRSVLTSVPMAFVAGGISYIYKIERLHIVLAVFIHMLVLYFDYLIFYLVNGYLPNGAIWIFTVIFVAGFLAIWVIIYMIIRHRIRRLNDRINITN